MKRASSGHYLWQEARWQVTKLKHRRVAEMGLIQDRVSLSTKGLGELDGKTVREKGIKLVYLITKYSQLHSKPLALAITRGRQPRIVNWQWGGICNCWVNFGSCPPLMTHERAPLSPLKMSLPKFIIAVKEETWSDLVLYLMVPNWHNDSLLPSMSHQLLQNIT